MPANTVDNIDPADDVGPTVIRAEFEFHGFARCLGVPVTRKRGQAALYVLRMRSRPLFPRSGGRLRPDG
jgi:hypothetical protein